jgi:hypothetical protein
MVLGKLDFKASLHGILVIQDERLPARRLPWRDEPLPRVFLPYRGLVGLAIICIFWPADILGFDPLAQYSFFPLWLGYILVVDSLVLRRTGSSLLVRNPLAVVGMFLLAIPYWWSFEWINQVTQNWIYIGDDEYPRFTGLMIGSLHFSVVIPAVFESAELIGSFGWIRRFGRGPRIKLSHPQLYGVIFTGFLSLAALLLWPSYFYPLTWLFLFLIFDPVNYLRGQPSVVAQLRYGDWRPFVAIMIGALLTGWFWEMWNSASVSWVYDIGFFDFAHVFEMPLLGYGGYLPFGLETFAVYHFAVGVLPWPSSGKLPVAGRRQRTAVTQS